MPQDWFQQKQIVQRAEQYPDMKTLLETFQKQGAPQTKVPETPYSQRAASGMEGSIAKNMPSIQDFLSQLLKTGGLDNDLIGQQIGAMETRGASARRDIVRDVTGAMPLGSTAAVSALSKGLSDQELSDRLAIMQFLTSMNQQKIGNKQGAVAGMEALPGYMEAPSSIELAMLNTKAPYALGNLQAQSEWMKQLLEGTRGSYYTPTMAIQPSKWDSTIGPIVSALISGGLGTLTKAVG